VQVWVVFKVAAFVSGNLCWLLWACFRKTRHRVSYSSKLVSFWTFKDLSEKGCHTGRWKHVFRFPC